MSDRPYFIPRHLDDPPMLFLWQADSVLLVVFFFILGCLLQIPIIATLLGFLAARAWGRMRESGARGLLPALLYWYGPLWLTGRPSSSVREYLSS